MKYTAKLIVSCPDRRGLVARISDFIFRNGGKEQQMTTDFFTMTPIEDISDPEMIQFAEEAKRFRASFVWCKKVTDCRLAQGFASLGVFLMELVPARVRVSVNICVVISQEPLSCSVCEWADGWRDALKHHVWQIRQWMKATHFAYSLVVLLDKRP